MRLRYPFCYLSILTSAAVGLFWHGGERQPVWAGPPAANAALPLALPDIVGEWSGSWTDTVYAVGGAMTFNIHRDGDAWFATGTIDVESIAPLLGVLEGSASGTSSGGVLSGTFSCTNLGSGSFVLTEITGQKTVQAATGTGSGTVVVPLGFGPFTFAGNVTDGTIEGTFDFVSPGGGKGKATMTKSTAVRSATWGAVKSAYDE